MPDPTTADLAIKVVPADVSRFDDVRTLLNPSGNDRACWCLSYRVTSAEYNALRGDQRGDRVKELCAGQPAPGVLAYRGDTAIGWCGVSPRSSFERLKRTRTMPALDDLPVWSVVCFVVRADHRRQGVTRALLDGAVDYARSQGAPAIEGFPVDPASARINSSAAHVGSTTVFEAAGFLRVRETGARSDKRPRWHMLRGIRVAHNPVVPGPRCHECGTHSEICNECGTHSIATRVWRPTGLVIG